MEDLNSFESQPHISSAKRIAGAFIAGIRLVGRQLAAADLNPHEGRLRSRFMPSAQILVPDFPPAHDNET